MEGVYMTKEEFAQYLSKDWRNGIAYRVDNNPTDVYDLIKANYGSEFQSFARGSETGDGAKKIMMDFLIDKAQQDPKGPEAYSVFIYVAIPQDLDTDNWTNQIQ